MNSNDPTVEQPGDRQQVMHGFGCGHTVRATRRTVRLRPELCWECRSAQWAASAPQRRRDRRRELATEAAKVGPRPTNVTPEQRAAQRVIVSLVQPRTGRCYLDRKTRQFRFTEARGEWGVSLAEIGAHLGTLNVPFLGAVMWRPKSQRGPGVHTWMELAVTLDDRPALLRWVPSLAAKIARAEARNDTHSGPRDR